MIKKNSEVMGFQRDSKSEFMFVIMRVKRGDGEWKGGYFQTPRRDTESVVLVVNNTSIDLFLIRGKGVVQAYDALTGTPLAGGETGVEALEESMKMILKLSAGMTAYSTEQRSHISQWGVSPAYERIVHDGGTE